MKKLLYTTLFTLFIAFGLSAQCISDSNKKYTEDGDHVKMERFDKNGNLVEVGTYLKNGVIDGKWTSYNADGSLLSVAYYSIGEKSGNWVHYDQFKNQVHQVSYEDGLIASSESIERIAIVED